MDTITPEVRAFLLEAARTGKIATVRADGRPHIVPIWFDLDDDNTVYFNTGESTVNHVSLCAWMMSDHHTRSRSLRER